MLHVDGERPLCGLRVLDLVQGPMATVARLLADLGADVIRVEPEEGAEDRWQGHMAAGISLDIVAANLGKRVTSGAELARLLPEADLVLTPPHVIGPGIAAAHPRLVVLTVSDFGDVPGFDGWQAPAAVLHALSGGLSRSGLPGLAPLLPPAHLAHGCAASQATFAALLACLRARRTGAGAAIDFATLEGVIHSLDPGFGISGSATSGVPAWKVDRGRADVRHRYPILPCRDGFVRLCLLAPRQWRNMFVWMGSPAEFADPAFAQLTTRYSSRTLLPAIAHFFADKTQAELETEGEKRGVPIASVLSRAQALASDQTVARGFLRPITLAPGLVAAFPDGALEIDGRRMGISDSFAGPSDATLEWRQRPPLPISSRNSARPLDGVRVLDLGVIVVGAETGRLLADQGADVIKIENRDFPDGARQGRPGEPMSQSFAAGHRNKRSLGINLRDPRGRDLLLQLVKDADVVLSNFKSGTLASLGLDHAVLKAVNPGIIVIESSAFGSSGPWAGRMGYGPLVRASSGLTEQWRYPDDPTSFSDAITVYPDHVAARMGAIGVLALLFRRDRTGSGGAIAISQAEVMLANMAAEIAADDLRRQGIVVADPAGSADVYRCAGDDEWCVVESGSAGDAARIASVTNGQALDQWIADKSPVEAMQQLQAAGVAAGAMLRVTDLPTFPSLAARHVFREAGHPAIAGTFPVEGRPIVASNWPDPDERPAPLAGQHTREIAAQLLGLSGTEIDAFIAEGILEVEQTA